MARRVMDVLDQTAREHGHRPALRVRGPTGAGGNGSTEPNGWESLTWSEYRDLVRLTARGFMALGLAPGQCVTIIGPNRPEWFLADLGAIAAGGVPTGIYATNSAEQCRYIAHHCEASIAVVGDANQLAKFRSVRESLPALRAIILVRGDSADQDVYSWSRLQELGGSVPESELDARIDAQKPDDVCTLIYTSGTTGEPKAVMLSHDNITWTAQAGGKMVDISPTDDVVSYLPLSHIAEQITTLHGPVTAGACTWFCESIEMLGETLREVRPTYFLGVPRVWEKVQEKMQAVAATSPPVKRRIARWARRQGLAGGYARQSGKSAPIFYRVADGLVFSKVRQVLGLDRARILVTSAAPISRHTLEFFLSLGLPLCEVYGMSECTGPATVSVPSRYRTGKVGVCMPGTELRIADDGEICLRGRHVFKGYYKDPRATADTLDADGWLHTGDVGTVDADGFLQITDRKKELIITAGGENIAPQMVEGELKSIPVVSQALVIGDRQRYLAVLLTLDPQKILGVATAAGSTARDARTAAGCERFMAYLQSQIDGVNRRLARVQAVKKFAVIPAEFTIEGGELTPSMKLRRKVIVEKYAEVIQRLYS